MIKKRGKTVAEIRHTPIKELNVLEYVKEKRIEDLALPSGLLSSATGQMMVLNWAEGIVFLFSVLVPNTDAAFLKLIEGKLYSPSIHYAEMPEYRSEIQTDHGIHVPVVDVTASSVMKELALWLKQREGEHENSQ